MLALLLGCEREAPEAGPKPHPSALPSSAASSGAGTREPPVPTSGVASAAAFDSSPVDMPESLPPPRRRELAHEASAVQRIFDGYGFPALADLTHWCSKRVMSVDGDWTTFDVFTSTRPPAALVKEYTRRLTRRGLMESEDGSRWELPVGAVVPQRSLTISKPSAPGRHTSCDTPGNGTKSVVTLLRNE